MMSLLFVYVVFSLILHILIIHYQDAVCLQQLLLQMSFLNRLESLALITDVTLQVKQDSSRIHQI